MKGFFIKQVGKKAVVACIMAAAITVGTSGSYDVRAEEISFGDSAGELVAPESTSAIEQEADAGDSSLQESVVLEEPAVQESVVSQEQTVQETGSLVEDASEPVLEDAQNTNPEVLSDSPVQAGALTLSATAQDMPEYDGQSHAVTVTLSGEATDADGNSYRVENGSGAAATVTVTATNVSESTFTVTDLSGVAVFNSENTAVSPASLTVNAQVIKRRPVTLRSMNLVKTYDGRPLTNGDTPLAEESGFVEGQGAYYVFTGSRTAVGTDINSFSVSAAKEGTDLNNYDISYTFGGISVVERTDAQKYILTVEALSSTAKYSGKDQSVSGYLLEGRSDSDFRVNGSGDPSQVLTVTIGEATFTVTGISATATGKNAGTYPVNITGSPVIRDSEGNDVTSEFRFEFRPGTLTIEKRKVVLSSASITKKYNGKVLTRKEVTVSGDGFAEGEGATFSVTGKQKKVGESYNYFDYTLNAGTLADNYDIEKVPGVIKVTKADNVAINEEPDEDSSAGSSDSQSSGSDSQDSGSSDAQSSSTGSQAQSADSQSGSSDSQSTASDTQPAQTPGESSTAPTDQAQAATSAGADTAEGATTASTEDDVPSVLGARRGFVTVDIADPENAEEDSDVLGARRASTADDTNMAGHVLIFAAAASFMAALKIKRNKRLKK